MIYCKMSSLYVFVVQSLQIFLAHACGAVLLGKCTKIWSSCHGRSNYKAGVSSISSLSEG